jgi:spore maturation protein CgeB
MRIAIVNTDYGEFLQALYEEHAGLDEASYAEQMAARNASLFGVADFYSANLIAVGHEAIDIHANNEPLQRAWAREHHLQVGAESLPRRALRKLGVDVATRTWFERILIAQVAAFKPNVLLVQDMISVPPRLVGELRRHARLVVGQHAAAPLPHELNSLRAYDLVISSFLPTVEALRRAGIDSELNLLAFEPRVLDSLPDTAPKEHEISFVGSLYPGVHDSRVALLEALAAEFGSALRIWTPTSSVLAADSPLRPLVQGSAYGREMYAILRASRITVNEHGSIAAYANNCRLFEATGVATALVTDAKPNLTALFDLDSEVAAYATTGECISVIHELLGDDTRREALAEAGQARTLREHTYRCRVEELADLLRRRLVRNAE